MSTPERLRAAHWVREAYMIGLWALLFGTLGACAIAGMHRIAMSNALLSCLRWQGTSSAIALCALAFL